MKSTTAMLGISLSLTLVASRLPAQATQDATTYAAVERGRVCTVSTLSDREINCDFRVGRSLRFTIFGVGLRTPGIAFMKSDSDGDYYGKAGFGHRCVIIWPGQATKKDQPSRTADLAFVSPITGDVYHDWASCHAGGTRAAR